ncbi:hypothetical protein HLV35_03110 [Eggerthellaceae bacterium zg-997]|nr:hypothetical protein [Eggerthellaceae bacterium zg-997]
MLRLTTERPALDFELDGKACSLPLSLLASEMADMVAIVGSGAEADAPSFVGWFLDFAAAYVGDQIRGLGDDGLTALMGAWTEARAKAGEPDMGES